MNGLNGVISSAGWVAAGQVVPAQALPVRVEVAPDWAFAAEWAVSAEWGIPGEAAVPAETAKSVQQVALVREAASAGSVVRADWALLAETVVPARAIRGWVEALPPQALTAGQVAWAAQALLKPPS